MHSHLLVGRGTGVLVACLWLAALGSWAAGCGTGGVRESSRPVADEPQGDTSPEGARAISSGATQQGYVEYVGDADWFRLEIPAGVDTMRVELSNQVLQSSVDLSVTVYGSDGLTILGGRYDSHGGDGLTQITLELTIEDLLFCYLVVRDHLGDDSDPLHPYFLKATVSSGPGDGNNSPESAAPLGCGQTLAEALQATGDVDWFRVEFPAGAEILSFSLTQPAGNPDPVLTLYESTATTAILTLNDPDGSNGPASLAWNARLRQTGSYYLAVRELLDDEADADLLYSLRADCLADPDATEPNDVESPALLAADSTVSGYLAFQGDEDFFRLTLPAAGLVNLNLRTASGNLPVQFLCTVLAADGSTVEAEFLVEAGDTPLDFTTRLSLPQGTHLVRLKDLDGDGADVLNPYSLRYHFDLDPDGNEPNGNFPVRQENLAHATPLTAGVAENGYIAANADQDWFRVLVAEPGVYHFSLSNAAASPVDLSLSLYRPDGVSLILNRYEADARGESGPTLIEGQLFFLDAGTYYLLVQDLDNNETDIALPYRLQVDSVPLPPGGQEPGEDRLNARLILPGQVVEGYMEFEGDRDWYGVLITGNQDLAVEIWTLAASPVEFVWFMYGPDSTEVYASAGDSDEEHEGPIFIRVAHNDPDPFWVDEDHPGVYLFKISDYNRNDFDTSVPYHFRVTLSPHQSNP